MKVSMNCRLELGRDVGVERLGDALLGVVDEPAGADDRDVGCRAAGDVGRQPLLEVVPAHILELDRDVGGWPRNRPRPACTKGPVFELYSSYCEVHGGLRAKALRRRAGRLPRAEAANLATLLIKILVPPLSVRSRCMLRDWSWVVVCTTELSRWFRSHAK